MIVQVCGNIIDTQYIYNISETYCRIDRCYFEIKFLNQNKVQIEFEYDRLKNLRWTSEECVKYRNECIQKLNNVKDNLICKWKSNQLVIPKIEFDENNITS